MKALPLSALITAMLAAALPVSQTANARTGIQRCDGADGSVVYTDRACGSMGATSMPMPGEVLTRIARDEAANAALHGDATAADAPRSGSVTGRRSPSAGCARSATQLSMDLQGSFALRNVNRLAESYHWVGQSHRQAQQLMLRLEELAEQPLLEAHYFDAQIGPGGMQLAALGNGSGNAGVMQLTFGDATSPRVVDFDVLRYAGCYFVRF